MLRAIAAPARIAASARASKLTVSQVVHRRGRRLRPMRRERHRPPHDVRAPDSSEVETAARRALARRRRRAGARLRPIIAAFSHAPRFSHAVHGRAPPHRSLTWKPAPPRLDLRAAAPCGASSSRRCWKARSAASSAAERSGSAPPPPRAEAIHRRYTRPSLAAHRRRRLRARRRLLVGDDADRAPVPPIAASDARARLAARSAHAISGNSARSRSAADRSVGGSSCCAARAFGDARTEAAPSTRRRRGREPRLARRHALRRAT